MGSKICENLNARVNDVAIPKLSQKLSQITANFLCRAPVLLTAFFFLGPIALLASWACWHVGTVSNYLVLVSSADWLVGLLVLGPYCLGVLAFERLA